MSFPLTFPATRDELCGEMSRDASMDAPLWLAMGRFLQKADTAVAWQQLLLAIECAEEVDTLCTIGTFLAEPLIQCRWPELLDQLQEAAKDRKFRMTLSCVLLSDLPKDVEELIDSLYPEDGSEEDIGPERT